MGDWPPVFDVPVPVVADAGNGDWLRVVEVPVPVPSTIPFSDTR